MEIGKLLFQQDVEGIPPLPTFEGAVEVQLPEPEVDAAAKYSVDTYNITKQGTRLEFLSTLVGWASPVLGVGTFFHILTKAKDGGKTKVCFAIVFTAQGKNYLLRFGQIFG